MLEMLILLQHGSFIDVVVGGHAVSARVLGELAYVFQVVAADVDIEKHHVAVDVLLAQHMLEVFLRRHQGLGQARLEVPGIHGKIKYRHPGIAQPVRHLRPQQSSVGAEQQMSKSALYSTKRYEVMG